MTAHYPVSFHGCCSAPLRKAVMLLQYSKQRKKKHALLYYGSKLLLK